jgi:hypothetical protein
VDASYVGGVDSGRTIRPPFVAAGSDESSYPSAPCADSAGAGVHVLARPDEMSKQRERDAAVRTAKLAFGWIVVSAHLGDPSDGRRSRLG